MLSKLLELSDAAALALVRPDGEVGDAVFRRTSGLTITGEDIDVLLGAGAIDSAGLTDTTPPPSWAATGIVRTAVQKLTADAGVVVVGWDHDPSQSQVAWLQVALTLLGEEARAEELLADLTARVDNAQQLANMGDYDWHIASDTNQWSDQLYRIYGHEPQSFNASYERFLAHIHPDDRDRITAIHQHAYATGEPYEMIERVVRPDGSVRYLSSNGQVVQDAAGVPIRMRGTCVDITDHVLAEQERERVSARFRSLVESAPDAILVLDLDSRIVQANGKAGELLGGDPIGVIAEEMFPGLRKTGQARKVRGFDGRAIELDVIATELDALGGEHLHAVYLRDAAVRLADEARAAAFREVQVRHRQALEINDDVIQGLTAAILAMQQDDPDTSARYLERTLSAARRLMRDWSAAGSADDAVQPGTLVRTVASTLATADQTTAASADGSAPPALARRVLVVDDSEDVRRLICAQIASLGTCDMVGQGADGEEAVRLTEALQPDLVLLDLSMPRMDGLQALPKILAAAPGVRVVVMSGFDQRSVADQVLAAGAVRYIEKGLRMNLPAVIGEVFNAA